MTDAKTLDQTEVPKFEELMRLYDDVETRLAELKDANVTRFLYWKYICNCDWK